MNQIDIIKKEFTIQSSNNFNGYMTTSDKQHFNNNVIEIIDPYGNENVLEIACGTCAFGRMLAPHISKIYELDVTEAMLEIGKKENEKAGINNVEYVVGEAEQLPFPNNTFDIVVTRLAFHHFKDPKMVFNEMCRVLKDNGQLVIIDMLARQQSNEIADIYEKLRDPSHIKCLTLDEFNSMAQNHNMRIEHFFQAKIPMELSSWMEITNIDSNVKDKIMNDMMADITNKSHTGFNPYMKDQKIMFDHTWVLLVYKFNN